MAEIAFPPFAALENALALDARGYVCTPATTLATAVVEKAPVKDKDGKWLRDENGEIVKQFQRVDKPAKVNIGSWNNAEPGQVATKKRFEAQLKRVLEASHRYGIAQGPENLGVAIITSKSGGTVIDVDAAKFPDPNKPGAMIDPDEAHDLLLKNIFRTAGIPDADWPDWLAWFLRLPHVRTPSGGWHYYFRRVGSQRPRMHTGMIRCVDIRAGYQNEVGEWESSAVAYAPGNTTLKGRYIAYECEEDGNLIEAETLPQVRDLPELPPELNALFEKTTTDIRRTAASLGIPVPATGARPKSTPASPMRRMQTSGSAGPLGTVGETDWNDLALRFVRSRQ